MVQKPAGLKLPPPSSRGLLLELSPFQVGVCLVYVCVCVLTVEGSLSLGQLLVRLDDVFLLCKPPRAWQRPLGLCARSSSLERARTEQTQRSVVCIHLRLHFMSSLHHVMISLQTAGPENLAQNSICQKNVKSIINKFANIRFAFL